jgi:hypothetical protein
MSLEQMSLEHNPIQKMSSEIMLFSNVIGTNVNGSKSILKNVYITNAISKYL